MQKRLLRRFWKIALRRGDITTPGGARRLTGDQTEALRASLINKPAKNVILLIGDGMGDSEITAARNYAQGAGGFFKGIDALPLTGQYTHYSLDKKNRETGLRDRLGGVRHCPGPPASRPITARWASIFMRTRIRPSSSWRKRRGWPPATFPPPSMQGRHPRSAGGACDIA